MNKNAWAEQVIEQWVEQGSMFPAVDQEIQESLKEIITTFVPDEDEYAAEKLIKSFVEGIRCLEKLRMYQNNLGPGYLKVTAENSNHRQVLDGIEAELVAYVRRQKKHFLTFLSAARRR